MVPCHSCILPVPTQSHPLVRVAKEQNSHLALPSAHPVAMTLGQSLAAAANNTDPIASTSTLTDTSAETPSCLPRAVSKLCSSHKLACRSDSSFESVWRACQLQAKPPLRVEAKQRTGGAISGPSRTSCLPYCSVRNGFVSERLAVLHISMASRICCKSRTRGSGFISRHALLPPQSNLHASTCHSPR